MNSESKPSSTLAITSLVLGIVSVLCLGILAGIPAIITGHMARGRAQKSPERYGNPGFGLAGLILGYVSIVETIAVLFVMLLPVMGAMGSAKAKAQTILCANHLKQVGLAVQMYAIDNKDEFPKTVAQLEKCLPTAKVLICPSDPTLNAESLDEKEFSRTSYIMTLEEASLTNVTKVIARCPVHKHTLTADGAVRRGDL